MKWIAIAAIAVALSGCGEPKPDNSMKAVAARIRDVYGHRDSLEALFTETGHSPDLKGNPKRGSLYARFVADDGYIWVKVSHNENETGPCWFLHETIQFSQSGKLESP